jgi:hypothetical protein
MGGSERGVRSARGRLGQIGGGRRHSGIPQRSRAEGRRTCGNPQSDQSRCQLRRWNEAVYLPGQIAFFAARMKLMYAFTVAESRYADRYLPGLVDFRR